MGRFSGQMHSAAQLVRIKTFSDGQLLKIGNLSVKSRGFTDKWIISCQLDCLPDKLHHISKAFGG